MKKEPLSGKVALVTGAARRIGAETARTLHQAGMNIVLHYNASEEDAIKLCDELCRERERSAVVCRADLQEAQNEQALVQKAADAWGRLDVLVNNASRFYRTTMGEVTEYAWDDLMNSNLKAPFFLSQAAMPFLKKSKGCIVNITDLHAERPLKDYSVYCLSKSGLMMLTKVLAKELGPDVRVNSVAPGAIMWPEGKNTLTEDEKVKIIERTILKRPGTAEDIAKAVLYFVRDADYVTGHMLHVDGGRALYG